MEFKFNEDSLWVKVIANDGGSIKQQSVSAVLMYLILQELQAIRWHLESEYERTRR